MEYTYLGDRMTDPALKDKTCRAIRHLNGKCVRGKNGNMLVEFDDGRQVNVIGRLLRKIDIPHPYPDRVGYVLTTASGHTAHVLGDKNMSPKTIEALQTLIDVVMGTPIEELKKLPNEAY